MHKISFSVLTHLLATLFFLLLPISEAFAQSNGATTGSIVGTVNDIQSAALAGATVKAKQPNTNFERTVQADQEGNFSFLQLSPGDYELEVEVDGFIPKNYSLTLNLGVTALVNFKLSPVGATDVVEVTARMNLGKTESSTNTTRERIDSLPINQRNFLDFATTAPRVVPDRLPNTGVGATTGLSFNGLPGRFVLVATDGLDNIDRSSGSVATSFSQDAVREFQVVSDGYSAEFGRSIGGVVNIVTRGGSNTYNGSVFFFNRNDKTSSRDAFSSFKPPFSQYQFGGVFSGPIKKDKAFFFTSFERLSLKQNNIVTIADNTVTSANRLGFPLRNGPIPNSIGQTNVLARTDINISSKDTFWFRYSGNFNYNGTFEPIGGLVGASTAAVQRQEDNGIAMTNTYTGTTFINETRFRYGQRDQRLISADPGPQVQLVAPEGRAIFGVFDNGVLRRFGDTFLIINNTTLVKGNNQIKFGVNYQRLKGPRDKSQLGIFPRGLAIFEPIDFARLLGVPTLPSFTGLQAFDPSLRTPLQRAFLQQLAALAPIRFPGFPNNVPLADLPIPAVYSQGFGSTNLEQDLVANQVALYLQDDIKVRSNLMLKFGLRYDLDRVSATPKNSGNIAPRVGIAYNPFEKLQIKAGYGIFFGSLLFGNGIVAQKLTSGNYNILALPFPFSSLPFTLPGGRIPESTQLPAGLPFVPQLSLIDRLDPNIRNSYSHQASFGIDYFLNRNTEFAVNYTLVRGLKIASRRNVNPVVRPIAGDPLTSRLIGRLDPTSGDIGQAASAFDSYYHGVTFSATRRLAKGFDLLASYTYSKAIDNVLQVLPTDTRVIDNPVNALRPGDERGLSIQDLRHRFVVSGNVALPLGKNIFLRDYAISFIVTATSGRPYNLIAGTDLNMNADDGDRPAGIGRNTGVTPGFTNFDVRLQRLLNFSDQYKMIFFAEAFNLFNKTNINPNTIDRVFPPDAQGRFNLPPQENGRFIVTPDRFRGAFSPRQIQLGFRVLF